ncbi:MAG: CDP-diacylglycerol--glycerol-3-phosphate 3-phosphatidyltransferase [Myxococcota bacterium]
MSARPDESSAASSAAETPDAPDAPATSSPEPGPILDASGQPREIFWNLPNTVTMLRIGVVPILLFIPMAQSLSGSRFMAWAFIIASVTDILDGWLARRDGGQGITRIGKLLDPLADKLLVTTALIMLLSIGRIPIWGAAMVVVIIGRELAVTGLRGMAGSQGLTVAAEGPGKLKAIAQSVAVSALLFHYETLGLPAHEIGMTLLAIATALTLWSGYLYFRDYFGWGAEA